MAQTKNNSYYLRRQFPIRTAGATRFRGWIDGPAHTGSQKEAPVRMMSETLVFRRGPFWLWSSALQHDLHIQHACYLCSKDAHVASFTYRDIPGWGWRDDKVVSFSTGGGFLFFFLSAASWGYWFGTHRRISFLPRKSSRASNQWENRGRATPPIGNGRPLPPTRMKNFVGATIPADATSVWE